MLVVRVFGKATCNRVGEGDVKLCFYHRKHYRPCHSLIPFFLGCSCFVLGSWLEECCLFHRSIYRVGLIKVELIEDLVDVFRLGKFDSLIVTIPLDFQP